MSQSVSASIHSWPKEGLQRNLHNAGTTLGCAGFLLAFEVRLAYLEKTPATEVSDGSTST